MPVSSIQTYRRQQRRDMIRMLERSQAEHRKFLRENQHLLDSSREFFKEVTSKKIRARAQPILDMASDLIQYWQSELDNDREKLKHWRSLKI